MLSSDEMGYGEEITVGSISTCMCFGNLDEIVESLQQSPGDQTVEPIEDPFPMTLDGLCGQNIGFPATVGIPEIPALQEGHPGPDNWVVRIALSESGGSDMFCRSSLLAHGFLRSFR